MARLELRDLPDDGFKCDFCLMRRWQYAYDESFMLAGQKIFKVVGHDGAVTYCFKLIVI